MITTEQEARILRLDAAGLSCKGICAKTKNALCTVQSVVERGRVRTEEERRPWEANVYKPSAAVISAATQEIRDVGWEDPQGAWHAPWTEEVHYYRAHGCHSTPVGIREWSIAHLVPIPCLETMVEEGE